MARPKPCAPPVTTAVRPWRSILFMLKRSLCCHSGSIEPGISRFRVRACRAPRSASKQRAPADEEVDAGGECALVAREIDRHIGDFLRGAEPAHLLASDEFL